MASSAVSIEWAWLLVSRTRGSPAGCVLGVWSSADIDTSLIVTWDSFSVDVGRSLFALRVQANCSPTYAAPNEGGRVKRGVRGNGSGV